jgi:hypothetical protein
LVTALLFRYTMFRTWPGVRLNAIEFASVGTRFAPPDIVMPWSRSVGPSRESRAFEMAFAGAARPRAYSDVRMMPAWYASTARMPAAASR